MRRALDRLFTLGAGVCAALAVGVILLIVGALVWRGGSAMSWSFFTEPMRLVGGRAAFFTTLSARSSWWARRC